MHAYLVLQTVLFAEAGRLVKICAGLGLFDARYLRGGVKLRLLLKRSQAYVRPQVHVGPERLVGWEISCFSLFGIAAVQLIVACHI